MKKSGSRTGQRLTSAADDDRPTVSEIMELMPEGRASVAAQLRDFALGIEGVEERVLYDGFCREWTPAYYFGKTQLFHIHNFRSGLRGTVFVGINTLEPIIMNSKEVSPGIRKTVSTTTGGRATKQVKFPLDSRNDVEAFKDLVRLKYSFASEQW